MVLLHVSGGGGERYGTPLYGEVSCLFSMGRDRIGPTPMLLPLSLLRYGGSWEKNAVKIISLKKFDEISKTHAPAFFIPLQPFERNGLSIFILPDRTTSHFILLFFPFRESNKKTTIDENGNLDSFLSGAWKEIDFQGWTMEPTTGENCLHSFSKFSFRFLRERWNEARAEIPAKSRR